MKTTEEVKFTRQKALLSFVCLLFAWIGYYWPTLASIFSIKKALWLTLSTYGIVIVFLSYIFARRKEITTTVFVSSQLGLLSLFLMVIIFVLGEVNSVPYAEQSSVMLMFPTLVLIAFGPLLIRTLFFPLLYLMFIIPLQDETLESRPVVVVVAVLVLIAYVTYQKFFRSKTADAFVQKPPLWFSLNARWLFPTGIAFSMLMVSPWLGDNIRAFYPVKHREIALRAPLGSHGWTGPFHLQGRTWAPIYKNASATLQEQYFNDVDRNSIYLYTAYFHSDRDFADLLNPINQLYDPSLWKQVGFSSAEVALSDNRTTNVFELTLEGDGVSRLVWYWYYVAGVSTTDVAFAEFLDKVRVVAKYAQGSGVIVVSTTYTGDPGPAKERLKSFLGAMYYGLDALKRPEISYMVPNQAGT